MTWTEAESLEEKFVASANIFPPRIPYEQTWDQTLPPPLLSIVITEYSLYALRGYGDVRQSSRCHVTRQQHSGKPCCALKLEAFMLR